jgi:hypothetical protein
MAFGWISLYTAAFAFLITTGMRVLSSLRARTATATAERQFPRHTPLFHDFSLFMQCLI